MRYLVPALLLAGAVGLAAPAFAQSSGEKDAQKQEKEAVKPAVYNVGISGMS